MRLLLTWTHAGQQGDPGPVMRLLAVGGVRYDDARVLTNRGDRAGARALVGAMGFGSVQVLDVPDPSDHAALFKAVGPVVEALPPDAEVDVLLSAGTPQAQTIWVILVQAGLLRARMLQVIPPRFVPHPHPEPVRAVRLDIDGFPEIRALRAEVVQLRARVTALAGTLVGESAAMRRLRERVARVGAARVPVLVLGETGTGKELVARAVHAASDRAEGPFVAENCGAFAEGVLQSELFGHEAGAFSGATGRHRGLFEQAHGGTLFLDEVGELPPRVQVQLLRVLQEGVLRRVGGEQPVRVDVRVVAATHRDLPALVARGEFREDLYYRLEGATLRVPPLRERAGDLELLVAHFLASEGRRLQPTRRAWQALQAYAWPGTVRELGAEVRRWTVFCDDVVDLADLSPAIAAGAPAVPPAAGLPSAGAPLAGSATPSAGASLAGSVAPSAGSVAPLAEVVAAAERAAVADALAVHRGNLSAAARALAVDRNTLKRKMSAFGLR